MRIGSELLPPKVFADQSDIGLFLFVRQEETSAQRTHPKQVEIVRGHDPAVQLHGLAHSGEDESHPAVRGQTGEDRLAVAVMPEARDRKRHLLHVALLRLAVDANDPIRLGEGEAAQEKAIDQSEDRAVGPDPESKSQDREEGKNRRFPEHPASESEVGQHIVRRFSFVTQGHNRIDPGGTARGEPAGQKSDDREGDDRREQSRRVEASNVIKQAGQGASCPERA